MGADPLTFAGLAGMGDLVLTATGALSRNRALGVALAQGETLRGVPRAHARWPRASTPPRAARRRWPSGRRRDADHRAGGRDPVRGQVAAPRPSRELMERTLKAEQWR